MVHERVSNAAQALGMILIMAENFPRSNGAQHQHHQKRAAADLALLLRNIFRILEFLTFRQRQPALRRLTWLLQIFKANQGV